MICKRASSALFQGMSEPLPRDAIDRNSYKGEDTKGHIFTDQTVVFNMETTGGQCDNQKEFTHPTRLYIYIYIYKHHGFH